MRINSNSIGVPEINGKVHSFILVKPNKRFEYSILRICVSFWSTCICSVDKFFVKACAVNNRAFFRQGSLVVHFSFYALFYALIKMDLLRKCHYILQTSQMTNLCLITVY